jgi:hypothetical protein
VNEVLIGELGSINTFATGTTVVSKISTLGHELRNDSVKDRVLEMEVLTRHFAFALFSCAQSSKVFTRFGSVLE